MEIPKAVLEVSFHSPYIRQCLNEYWRGDVSFDDALNKCVSALLKQCNATNNFLLENGKDIDAEARMLNQAIGLSALTESNSDVWHHIAESTSIDAENKIRILWIICCELAKIAYAVLENKSPDSIPVKTE